MNRYEKKLVVVANGEIRPHDGWTVVEPDELADIGAGPTCSRARQGYTLSKWGDLYVWAAGTGLVERDEIYRVQEVDTWRKRHRDLLEIVEGMEPGTKIIVGVADGIGRDYHFITRVPPTVPLWALHRTVMIIRGADEADGSRGPFEIRLTGSSAFNVYHDAEKLVSSVDLMITDALSRAADLAMREACELREKAAKLKEDGS